MMTNTSDMYFLSEKIDRFFGEIYSFFESTCVAKSLSNFEGNENELIGLISNKMTDGFYSVVTSIGTPVFNDPLEPNLKWWEIAANYMMKYPFFRKYYSVECACGVGNQFSQFSKFCCLSVIYSFSKNSVACAKSSNRVFGDVKSLFNSSNFYYYTLKAGFFCRDKLYIVAIFFVLALSYQYGFSTIVPLKVFDPSFFSSLLGFSGFVFAAFSLVYFFIVMQKNSSLWAMFFESSSKTDCIASGCLGSIFIGCGTFFLSAPLVLSILGSDVNRLVVDGRYQAAIKEVKSEYPDDLKKQSYMLSQIYLNAYESTGDLGYKTKGLLEASVFLGENYKSPSNWPVSNVVHEMNARLSGREEDSFWFTSKNYGCRKLGSLILIVVGFLLFLFPFFKKNSY